MINALGIDKTLSPPQSDYRHGWGANYADIKPFIATRYLRVDHSECGSTTIPFNILDGYSLLTIGLGFKKFANTVNSGPAPFISFRRRGHQSDHHFPVYISKDRQGNGRLRLELVPYLNSTVCSLMCNVKKHPSRNIVEKIHRFSYASSGEMQKFLPEARLAGSEVEKEIQAIYDSCLSCALSGRPFNRRKVSISHINEAFDENIQAYFTVIYVQKHK